MSVISINADGLKKNINNLAGEITELQHLNQKLESIVTEIGEQWKGMSSQAYLNMMHQYIKRGKQMESVLQEYMKYAGQVVERFETIDRDSANKLYHSF